MKIEHLNKKEHVTLNPGDYYVTDQDAIISTLLGSCISACLYDPVNKVMGMNHFLLSRAGYNNASQGLSDAGRYGVHAMELVINDMLKLGAKRKYIQAKAFGGGNVLSSGIENDNYFTVGEQNVRFIREFLNTEDIPMVKYDLGGDYGRVVRFYAGDYSVYVKRIKKITPDLVKRDREYLKNSLEKQTTNKNNVELW